ncbi:MAG: methyl-accepting chemotaxis protein, partial [Treponema sp.]|nr:methyl-accepting chemotaxis protein [Treponema sp.]
VLVISGSIIAAADLIITREMEADTFNQISANARANATLIETELNSRLNQLWEIANRARTRTMNWEGAVRQSLEPDVSRIDCMDLGLVFPDGTAHYVSDNSTANLSDRDYVKKAFSGKDTLSDVILSRVTNKLVLMFASPVLKSDEQGAPVIGVLIARKDGGTYLDSLLEKIQNANHDSYAFLINREGTYTAHSNTDLVLKQFNPIKEAQKDPSLKSLGDMVAKAINEKTGVASYVQDGKRMICAFTEIPNQPWILVLTIERDLALAHLARIRLIMFLIGGICTVIGIFIAIITGRSIAKPVISIANTLQDVGKGDLTPRIGFSSKDEIGDLSRNFNLTLENIKALIMTIKKESETLSHTGTALAGNTTESAAAVNEIDATIQSIKVRVVNQSASVTQTNATMEQISVNIDKLNELVKQQSLNVSQSSSSIEEMLANIQSVTQTLVKNADNVKELMDASEVGRTGLSGVAEDIQKIARESEGLLEINSVMENISSQTNLLSMNAAIEAAHAGEAGKGFSVVADEIRKLAESSGEQSKTIGSVLTKIKESIDKITSSTGNVLDKFGAIDSRIKTVSEQELNIRNAMEEQGAGSKQILEALSQLNGITRQVKDGSEQMLEGSKEVITESRNLEKATQEISGGMGEMAQGAEQINAAVGEVNKISEQNKEIIGDLIKALSRFKVE